MRLTREESREKTREKLLESACHLVAARGYDGTSIADISEAAGFSKGAFFSNFESKDAILLEVLRRFKADEIAMLEATLARSVDEPTAAAAAGVYFERIKQQSDWIRLDIELQLHAARSASFAAEYVPFQAEVTRAIGTLALGLFAKSGSRPTLDPTDIGAMFIALIHGLVLHQHPDPARILQWVTQTLVDGLAAQSK